MDHAAVGLYIRLSREDDDRELESQSISNQRDFLLRYTQAHNFKVAEIYIDDGFSGTSFNRPGFQKMLRDIEARKISTVITKDLSRLGRDYIQTGHYLERYFPEKDVRFIAVNDNIDTGKRNESANELTPFLSVINDMYAKDISKKVKTALSTKRENGLFIGSTPPLGYQKDSNRKGHLIIDEPAAQIIRKIFLTYLQTGSIIGVAKILTEQQVPTPSQYGKMARTQQRFPGLWSNVMIKRILTNPTYAGHLTQNRTQKVSHKLKKRIQLPPDEWIIVHNTHAPIVSQKEFDQVQEMLRVRSYTSEKKRGSKHLLSGLVFCADCGSPMTFVRESQARTYLVCRASRYSGRLKLCTSHCIRESYVEQTIKDALRQMANQVLDEKILADSLKNPAAQQAHRQLEKLNHKLQFSKRVAASLYKDKVKGILSEEQFVEMNQQQQSEQAALEAVVSECAKKLAQQQDSKTNEQMVKRLLNFEELDRQVLLALVEKITVHHDKTIEILFRFRNPC